MAKRKDAAEPQWLPEPEEAQDAEASAEVSSEEAQPDAVQEPEIGPDGESRAADDRVCKFQLHNGSFSCELPVALVNALEEALRPGEEIAAYHIGPDVLCIVTWPNHRKVRILV